jgi:hypothetical protein
MLGSKLVTLKKIRQAEDENRPLKRMLVEQALDI